MLFFCKMTWPVTWLILAHLFVAVIWDPVPVDGVFERYLQVAMACDFSGFLANRLAYVLTGHFSQKHFGANGDFLNAKGRAIKPARETGSHRP